MDERPGFGLYVHWPFCQAKCPYCDFNSHVTAKIDHSAWVSAYLSEIRRLGAETEGRVLDSVFFGGGTPSLMAPETVDAILNEARAVWRPSNDMEITLEANPTSVEAGKFRAFRDAGVNRVSVGLQALRDHDLKALGRLHSAEEGRLAFDVARETFERVSFDLIYARQNQSLEAWRSELKEALSLAADHLSLYQLTVEPGTAFAERFARGGLRGLPDEDVSADMYALTQDLTGEAGLIGYETSNHAIPGAESRHNLIYWSNGDWVGIGPGAHGRLTLGGVRYATEAPKMPGAWLAAVRNGTGQEGREALSSSEVREEAVMMGLRLR
ncbi:MAG: coproporphyrinogen III oxidase, partial [Boseongicola sp.]|nr:coproporphyrinogen III oxidase [Boseongicola sp.]